MENKIEALEAEEIKRLKLHCADALKLWKQGKEIWNSWFDEKLEYEIDFRKVDFTKHIEKGATIDFRGFKFPKGTVSFVDVNFGDLHTNFDSAHFFGYVSFSNATFGSIRADFCGAKFDGGVTFWNTDFGKGDIYFVRSNFTKGADFSDAKFGNRGANFTGSNFSNGEIIFINVEFGAGHFGFENVNFNGDVDFSGLKVNKDIKSVSFKNSSFNGTLCFSDINFETVVDLTGTRLAGHVELGEFKCSLKVRTKNILFLKYLVAEKHEDRFSFARLKELAENNKDHANALEFHANEMRAKRWYNKDFLSNSILDLVYDKLSNYGRSLKRPLFCLISVWLFFSGLYFLLSPNIWISTGKRIEESMAFSGGLLIPLFPSSSVARSEGVEILFFNNLSPLLHFITSSQSLLAATFLFLFGLAMRNRFRI